MARGFAVLRVLDVEIEVGERLAGAFDGQLRGDAVAFAGLDDLLADEFRLVVGEPEFGGPGA